MAIAKRHLILGMALMATLAAAGWLAGEDNTAFDVVSPAPPRKSATPAKEENLVLRLSLFDQRREATGGREIGDVFAAKSWFVPPPPAPPVVQRPPPPPTAPPLPYTYLGKIEQNGTTTVFLGKQDDSYAVKVGDTLENAYRIENIKGSVMTLMYLPLNQQQTLRIGEVN